MTNAIRWAAEIVEKKSFLCCVDSWRPTVAQNSSSPRKLCVYVWLRVYGIIKLFIFAFGMTKAFSHPPFMNRQLRKRKTAKQKEPARVAPESSVPSRRLKTLKSVVMERENFNFLASSRSDEIAFQSLPLSRTCRWMLTSWEPFADSEALNCYHVLSIETLKRFMAHFWCLLLYDIFKEIFYFSSKWVSRPSSEQKLSPMDIEAAAKKGFSFIVAQHNVE